MRVTVVNRSGDDMSVEFEDGKKKSIPAGQSAELAYTYFFMNSAIVHAGVKKKFSWKLPPRELIDRRTYPRSFRFVSSLTERSMSLTQPLPMAAGSLCSPNQMDFRWRALHEDAGIGGGQASSIRFFGATPVLHGRARDGLL
jgi:hypothetical protein